MAADLAQIRAELAAIAKLVGLASDTLSCRREVDDVARRVPLIREAYSIRQEVQSIAAEVEVVKQKAAATSTTSSSSGAAKASEPTPAPAAAAKAPEPTPAPVAAVKAPEPTPAPVAAAKAPEPTPAPVAAAKAPEPTPAAKAPEPTPAPVAAAKTPEPTPAPVAAATTTTTATAASTSTGAAKAADTTKRTTSGSGKGLPADAVARIEANDPDFTKCDLSNSSIFTAKPDEWAAQIAEALKQNTNLQQLVLVNVGLSSAGAVSLAEALKVNQTLTTLNLEKNNLDSHGIQAIGEMLEFNKGLVELNLMSQSLGAPGEGALTAFINSFEYNTSITKIIWRLTSRQSFKINACITRNNEIARRQALGKSVSDIDPNLRRETAARILAEREATGGKAVVAAPKATAEITTKIAARGPPYTIKEMTVRKELLPDDVDPDRREEYLSDDDFKQAFGMDRATFSKSPAWKRKQKKQEAGLF